MPTNLQRIWNESFSPPWESDYHLNIKLQMNYWIAESCNLSECHEPLFDFLERLQINGRKTAKTVYGANGFVAHALTNVWATGRTSLVAPIYLDERLIRFPTAKGSTLLITMIS